MKTLIIAILFLFPLILFTQSSGDFKFTKKFYSNFSAGTGIALALRGDRFYSSFNYSIELNFHTGKGYFTGIGLLHHAVPYYSYNQLTYLYVQERKGFYLYNRFAIFGGIGGTIGASNHGHPGCCVGGAYFTVLGTYDLFKYLTVGIEAKSITDFSEVTLIPGGQLILRFY